MSTPAQKYLHQLLNDIEEHQEEYELSHDLIDHVRKVVDLLTDLPYDVKEFISFVAPTKRQSIQLEFEYDQDKYLEFEFYLDGRICMYEQTQPHTEGTYDEISIKEDPDNTIKLLVNNFIRYKCFSTVTALDLIHDI